MKTKKYIQEYTNKRNIEIQKIYDYTIQTIASVAEEYGLTYKISTEITKCIKKDYYTYYNLFDIFFKQNGTQLSVIYPKIYLKNDNDWDTNSIYGFFKYGKYVRKFRISIMPIQMGIKIDKQVREYAQQLLNRKEIYEIEKGIKKR